MSVTRLKELRGKKDISLRELSEHISLSFSAIAKVERGEQELRVNDIIEICSYFKCSSDYLLCISDEDTTTSHLILNNDERTILENLQQVSNEGVKAMLDYSAYIKSKYPDDTQKILYNGQQLNFVRGVKDEK